MTAVVICQNTMAAEQANFLRIHPAACLIQSQLGPYYIPNGSYTIPKWEVRLWYRSVHTLRNLIKSDLL